MTDPYTQNTPPTRGTDDQQTVPLVPGAGYGDAGQGPWVEQTAVDPFAQQPAGDSLGQFGYTPTPGYSNPTFAPPADAVPEPAHYEQPPRTASFSYSEPPGPAAQVEPLPYQPIAAYGYSPLGSPYGQALPEHPNAVPALVLGILGLFFGVTAPVAWVMGAVGRNQTRQFPDRYRPSGMLTAGMVLGIIVTVGWMLLVGLFVLGVVLFAAR